MKNITSKAFAIISIAIFVNLALASTENLALASNKAGVYFINDFGKMYEAQIGSQIINLNAKFLHQNPYSFNWNKRYMEGDGGKITLLSASKPIDINSFVLEPSFLFANGVWEKGDFNYFYGKPDLPRILGFGMSLSKGISSLTANYIFGNGKILSNSEDKELFNSDFYIYNMLYELGLSKSFNLHAGFAGLNADIAGALTAENQQYFLFPYSFYKVSAHLNLKLAYGFANFKLESNAADYAVDLGAAVAVYDNAKGDMHYKYRKFYGTDEGFDTFEYVPMRGSGLIFSILSIKSKKINFGKSYIQYGVLKPLAMPFGDFLSTSMESDISTGEIIREILLFGLTANVNVYF